MSGRKITSQRLAAVALLQLEGATRAVDTEDLAMKMAALAPDRFRWKKYPEQIDDQCTSPIDGIAQNRSARCHRRRALRVDAHCGGHRLDT